MRVRLSSAVGMRGMRVMRPRARRQCRSHFGDQWAEIFVGEAVGLEPKQRQRGEQGMAAHPGAGPGMRVPVAVVTPDRPR